MPYSIEWLVDNSILYIQFEGDTADDLSSYDAQMLALLDTLSHPVHAIVDVRRVTKFAPLRHQHRIQSRYHRNSGSVVMIGINMHPVIRMFVTIVLSLSNNPLREATDLTQAFAILQTMDASLPDLSHLVYPFKIEEERD
jgi:hypothetical protein